jgi:hypothetical protein
VDYFGGPQRLLEKRWPTIDQMSKFSHNPADSPMGIQVLTQVCDSLARVTIVAKAQVTSANF